MSARKEEAPPVDTERGSSTQQIEVQSAGVTLSARERSNADASDPVMSTIRGGQMAKDVVLRLQEGCAAPDALLEALQAVVASADPYLLRAFVRCVQKVLEPHR